MLTGWGNKLWEMVDDPLESLGFIGDTEREQALESQRRSYNTELGQRFDAHRPAIAQMQDHAQYGAKSLEDALMQNIQSKYEQQGRNAVQNAAARGLISSGYTAAVGRDLDYRQGQEETGARAQAASFFQQAMQMSTQMGIGLDEAIMSLLLQSNLGFEAARAQASQPFLQTIGGGGAASGAGSAMGAAWAASDMRLKTDIALRGVSPAGVPVYTFRYKSEPGRLWQGTMAQDLLGTRHAGAVTAQPDGTLAVCYDRLDVSMVEVV